MFIAWEHALLDLFAKGMVKKHGGRPEQVPSWPGHDFDTIFVFKITREPGREKITFTIDHEGLDNLSDKCPGQ